MNVDFFFFLCVWTKKNNGNLIGLVRFKQIGLRFQIDGGLEHSSGNQFFLGEMQRKREESAMRVVRKVSPGNLSMMCHDICRKRTLAVVCLVQSRREKIDLIQISALLVILPAMQENQSIRKNSVQPAKIRIIRQ